MNQGFNPRTLILLFMMLGSLFGGWIGYMIDHNFFGLWTNFLGVAGALGGIWAGYKLSKNL